MDVMYVFHILYVAFFRILYFVYAVLRWPTSFGKGCVCVCRLQAGGEGVGWLAKSRPVSAGQHSSDADTRPVRTAHTHQLLAHHARLRLAGDRRRHDGHSELSHRDAQSRREDVRRRQRRRDDRAAAAAARRHARPTITVFHRQTQRPSDDVARGPCRHTEIVTDRLPGSCPHLY